MRRAWPGARPSARLQHRQAGSSGHCFSHVPAILDSGGKREKGKELCLPFPGEGNRDSRAFESTISKAPAGSKPWLF